MIINGLNYEPCGHTSHYSCFPGKPIEPGIVYQDEFGRVFIAKETREKDMKVLTIVIISFAVAIPVFLVVAYFGLQVLMSSGK